SGTWTAVDLETDQNLYAFASVAANDIWLVGAHDTLVHYDGSTWEQVKYLDTDKDTILYDVCGISGNDFRAFGSKVAFNYDGTEWKEAYLPLYARDAWCTNAQNIWVVDGSDGVLFNGREWLSLSRIVGFPQWEPYAVWGTGVDDIWVLCRHTIVHHP
ncbi:MAG: hypothetical protein GXP48_04690, partial [Acidobacteria bacterium]|nr:hypothetical protein [Acidobacteriota bacterium]